MKTCFQKTRMNIKRIRKNLSKRLVEAKKIIDPCQWIYIELIEQRLAGVASCLLPMPFRSLCTSIALVGFCKRNARLLLHFFSCLLLPKL